MLMPEIQKSGAIASPPELKGVRFDQARILPDQLVWDHTKTDEVSLPVNLLNMYRNAAFEAAERYTGMLFREQRVVTQDVADTRDLTAGHRWKSHYTVKLKYPTVDGVVYLYGDNKHAMRVQELSAVPGSNTIKVPHNHFALDMTPCCGDPCGKRPGNFGMRLMYRAGFNCEDDIPECVKMGALKYIAWVQANPGSDDTGRDGSYQGNVTQAGGNNASWKSGAIEEWRLCTSDF